MAAFIDPPSPALPGARDAPAAPGVTTAETQQTVVAFEQVSFAFDEHLVLDDVSFSVPKGAMRILLGASGAGKPVPVQDPAESRAEFIVLHEGRIHFEGTATELLASPDAYLRHFLFMTLPPW